MAGDWIKFDVTTPDKPEVVKMAADLGIDQDAVVGKLLRVWAWADQNTVICNGESNGVTVTSSFLDRLTFCVGFANAMREAGWLSGSDGNLSFPNFDRHNGKTAKERAVSNRRVAKHRQGNGSGNASVTEGVTPAPLQKPLPEKRERREEQEPHLPPKGESADGEDEKPKPKREREPKIGLDAFLQACRDAGESAVPTGDPVFVYADSIGLPRDFVALAWRWFKGRYATKRQAGIRGWRQTFRNAVEGNWPKFWYVDDAGQWHLTTTGKQAQMAAGAQPVEAAA